MSVALNCSDLQTTTSGSGSRYADRLVACQGSRSPLSEPYEGLDFRMLAESGTG